MQPQLRQMPPNCSRSTTAVFMPSCAARIAATYPPGPPPSTMVSKEVSAMGGFLERFFARRTPLPALPLKGGGGWFYRHDVPPPPWRGGGGVGGDSRRC